MFTRLQEVGQFAASSVLYYPAVAMPAPSSPDVPAPLATQTATIRAERDEVIVAQGDEAGYCYFVVDGCLRTVQLMEDGRRQIGEFLFPGDLFGWEALGEHDFAAEAVTAATLRRFPRQALEALADRDRDFARQLLALSANKLRMGRSRILVLGRKTAPERIASFLLELAERTTPNERNSVELPMSRSDIADYLGLTIETVCRGLTQLRRENVIAVERGNVIIRDRRALGAAGCETVHRATERVEPPRARPANSALRWRGTGPEIAELSADSAGRPAWKRTRMEADDRRHAAGSPMFPHPGAGARPMTGTSMAGACQAVTR